MNKSIAEELVTHLREEAQAYEALYTLLQEEKDALVQWSIGELREIVAKKETQLEHIHALEQNRDEFLQSIQDELKNAGIGFNGAKGSLTLTDIIHAVREEERRPLVTIQRDLTQLVQDVTTTNHTNQMLLKRSYELVNANLNIYKQSEKLAQTYSANGAMRAPETSRIVDGAL